MILIYRYNFFEFFARIREGNHIQCFGDHFNYYSQMYNQLGSITIVNMPAILTVENSL